MESQGPQVLEALTALSTEIADAERAARQPRELGDLEISNLCCGTDSFEIFEVVGDGGESPDLQFGRPTRVVPMTGSWLVFVGGRWQPAALGHTVCKRMDFRIKTVTDDSMCLLVVG